MVLNNILKLINVAKEFIFSNITHTIDIFWTHWFDSWLYVFKPLDLRIYLFIHVVSFNYFNFVFVKCSSYSNQGFWDIWLCCIFENFSYGIAVHESEFGLGVGPTFLMNMWCRGNETDLLNCKFAKADDCKPENTAGVICGEYWYC